MILWLGGAEGQQAFGGSKAFICMQGADGAPASEIRGTGGTGFRAARTCLDPQSRHSFAVIGMAASGALLQLELTQSCLYLHELGMSAGIQVAVIF